MPFIIARCAGSFFRIGPSVYWRVRRRNAAPPYDRDDKIVMSAVSGCYNGHDKLLIPGIVRHASCLRTARVRHFRLTRAALPAHACGASGSRVRRFRLTRAALPAHACGTAVLPMRLSPSSPICQWISIRNIRPPDGKASKM